MRKPETKIQDACELYLKENGYVYISNKLPTVKGEADLVLNLNGKYVEIEFKTKDGRLSLEQRRRKEYVEKMKGGYIIIRSKDMLKEFLGKGVNNDG